MVTGGEIEQKFLLCDGRLAHRRRARHRVVLLVSRQGDGGPEVAKYMSLISTIFLRLIKMIIGPLVLSTLIVGIAATWKTRRRSGGSAPKTMGWFVCASIASLTLGLFMVNLLQPGVEHRHCRSGRADG